jgi:hypothetical protein
MDLVDDVIEVLGELELDAEAALAGLARRTVT